LIIYRFPSYALYGPLGQDVLRVFSGNKLLQYASDLDTVDSEVEEAVSIKKAPSKLQSSMVASLTDSDKEAEDSPSPTPAAAGKITKCAVGCKSLKGVSSTSSRHDALVDFGTHKKNRKHKRTPQAEIAASFAEYVSLVKKQRAEAEKKPETSKKLYGDVMKFNPTFDEACCLMVASYIRQHAIFYDFYEDGDESNKQAAITAAVKELSRLKGFDNYVESGGNA
jgi:hypothetical protein